MRAGAQVGDKKQPGDAGDTALARAVRPRNRRALIIAAGADLFSQRGYSRVGMSDIAGAVGIGPSALYRHFAGKQQLLMCVVRDRLLPFQQILQGVDPGELDAVVRRLAAAALDNRELGVLWQRESRHLPDDERAELKDELRAVATGLAGLVSSYRPEVGGEDARFRAWSLFSALTSPSYHKVELPREQFETLISSMVLAIVTRPPLAFGAHRSQDHDGGRRDALAFERRASRRRLLLAAATRLFAERGYASVTTEDIGAAVGISGPSVYNHFASKQELLNAVITRGNAWLEVELERTLASESSVDEALHDLLRSYTDFALEHRGFIDLLIGELDHLPDLERHRARQTQSQYVSEWVGLLREARPDLDPGPARVLVQAALTAANDMARTGRVRDADAVVRVGEALLLATECPR